MPMNERSIENLDGVHPDLVAVVQKAAEKCEFLVTDGVRSLERQKTLKKAGKSKTLNSRHLTSHAVDLCDCDGCYDVPDMDAIAKAMKTAAIELNIPIEWGGDWKSFVDTPHFQLPWKEYPASGIGAVRKVVEAIKTKPFLIPMAAGGGAVAPDIPPPPDMSMWTAWQTAGETIGNLGTWAWNRPVLTSCLAVWITFTMFGQNLVARFFPASAP